MKVKDLIELLKKAPPEADVLAYDPNSESMEEVTGMIYGGSDFIVELQTDEL